jgi:hypothetical protein
VKQIRDVAFLAVLTSVQGLSSCSEPVEQHTQDVVIVRGAHRQPASPLTAPSTRPAEIVSIREDGELQQLAMIAALRDADPYRLADVDLPGNVADTDKAVGM